jgi:hypothetical protein
MKFTELIPQERRPAFEYNIIEAMDFATDESFLTVGFHFGNSLRYQIADGSIQELHTQGDIVTGVIETDAGSLRISEDGTIIKEYKGM